MTTIQLYLAELPLEVKNLFTPIYKDIEQFYTVVYLIARNEHVTEQEKPDQYETRLQMIRSVRNIIERQLTSWGLNGDDIVADIASDYFEDYVNYREPELNLSNELFVSIIQKLMRAE